jgi:hypothetical protein
LEGEIDGHQCKIYDATGLPMGMIDGTNPENFFVNRGGYNCGHELIPVSEVSVPKEVRERFEKINRKGNDEYFSDYKRVNTDETILEELKLRDDNLKNLKILENARGKVGETNGNGTIFLSKNTDRLFKNAIDKMLQNKSEDITPKEAGATLTYWHESTHNLNEHLLSQVKFKDNQESEMELATEFYAKNTLQEFYNKFGAKFPNKIYDNSDYDREVGNYNTAVNKLIEIGGINKIEVLSKLKQHLTTGKWEDQRTGLIDALYGAKIDGKLIDKRKLGIIVQYALDYKDFQFEIKMNKLLGF